MKYFFYSPYGESISIPWKLGQQGKQVYTYIFNSESKLIGKNSPANVVDNFYKTLMYECNKEDTIIIFDSTGHGDEAEYLNSKGWKTMGSCIFADEIENKRDYATKLFSEFMDVPPTKNFTDFEKAKEFILSQPTDYRGIFKPDGADTPKDWTYVSKNSKDLISQMKYYEENWDQNNKVSFQLQTFIEGTEFDFGGWFNGKGWLENSFECYFEDKKVLSGDLGPAQGCSSALEWFTTSEEPYFKRVLSKTTEMLKKNKFTGDFAINNIYSGKGNPDLGIKPNTFYMLEVTPRFGYDALQNQCHGISSNGQDITKLFEACALANNLPKNYFPIYKYLFDVRFYIPPYPNEKHAKDAKGTQIRYNKKSEDNIYWYDVMINEEKNLECAGASGMIGAFCESGIKPEFAIEEAYRKIRSLDISGVGYRSDGGENALKRIKELDKTKAIL
jgi:phosphoribosylamine-glycine ligase